MSQNLHFQFFCFFSFFIVDVIIRKSHFVQKERFHNIFQNKFRKLVKYLFKQPFAMDKTCLESHKNQSIFQHYSNSFKFTIGRNPDL